MDELEIIFILLNFFESFLCLCKYYQTVQIKLLIFILRQIKLYNKMNIEMILIIFQVLGALVLSRNLVQSWPYCDQWSNNCKDELICRSNQCVPYTCVDTINCASGFFCENNKCIAYNPPPITGRYCDQWTPCSATTQCYKRKCIPLTC